MTSNALGKIAPPESKKELAISSPTLPVLESGNCGAYSSEELAKRCRVSLKFVIKNRHRIKGAFRAGRVWRFDVAAVERAIKLKGELF